MASLVIRTPWGYFMAAVASLFALITVVGNFLVVFAVFREHYLRSMTNYFIVSLAMADLLVGGMVMPFSIHFHFLNEGEWIFGETWCDLWHALDVWSATASILNLCMIAVERYWATEHPLSYTSRMSKRHCLGMVAAVWVSSACISFPAIAWWRLVRSRHESRNASIFTMNNSCDFTDDSLYLITSSIVSFYGPLVVMVLVYYRIYRTATALLKSMSSGRKVISRNGIRGSEEVVLRIHRGGSASVAGGSWNHAETCSLNAAHSCHNLREVEDTATSSSSALKRVISNQCVTHHSNLTGRLASAPCSRHGSQQGTLYTSPGKEMTPRLSIRHRFCRQLVKFAIGKRLPKLNREQKAAKTLGLVMGIFIGCWLPFFTCNLLQAISPRLMDTTAAQAIVLTTTWLGYVNSSLNPFIYAHSMRDFRRAFIKILCGWYLRRRYSSYGNLFMGGEWDYHTSVATGPGASFSMQQQIGICVSMPQSPSSMQLRKFSAPSGSGSGLESTSQTLFPPYHSSASAGAGSGRTSSTRAQFLSPPRAC